MKMLAALAFFAVTLVPGAIAASPAGQRIAKPTRPAASPDWTTRVATTAEGGFLVGNPAAKVKLVEYGSLSCPTCQRFHGESFIWLRARIATGMVSVEFRPFAVHSADPVLHALLRCAGPANFLSFSDDFYDGQAMLVAGYQVWARANPTTNPSAIPADRIKYADQWGFTAFAATHGLTRARAVACLSDTPAFMAQQKREDTAHSKLGVAGTPTFFLGGRRLDSAAWPDVDAAIAAALG